MAVSRAASNCACGLTRKKNKPGKVAKGLRGQGEEGETGGVKTRAGEGDVGEDKEREASQKKVGFSDTPPPPVGTQDTQDFW